jgi:hypothetical protein
MDSESSFSERLRRAVAELRAQAVGEWPHVDPGVGPRGPLWRLVDAFGKAPAGSAEHHRLAWLALHASRRSLVHWEWSCDGTEPHEALHAVRTWLGHKKPPANSWETLAQPCEPEDTADARHEDARCTGLSVAHLARFARSAHPEDAFYAMAYADRSFSHSPPDVREHFRLWIVDVAVTAALAERDLNPSEAKAVRAHDSGTMRRRAAAR